MSVILKITLFYKALIITRRKLTPITLRAQRVERWDVQLAQHLLMQERLLSSPLFWNFHSTFNGKPLAGHWKETLSSLNLFNSVSSCGLSNHGATEIKVRIHLRPWTLRTYIWRLKHLSTIGKTFLNVATLFYRVLFTKQIIIVLDNV